MGYDVKFNKHQDEQENIREALIQIARYSGREKLYIAARICQTTEHNEGLEFQLTIFLDVEGYPVRKLMERYPERKPGSLEFMSAYNLGDRAISRLQKKIEERRQSDRYNYVN
jgi:hypothetical protein